MKKLINLSLLGLLAIVFFGGCSMAPPSTNIQNVIIEELADILTNSFLAVEGDTPEIHSSTWEEWCRQYYNGQGHVITFPSQKKSPTAKKIISFRINNLLNYYIKKDRHNIRWACKWALATIYIGKKAEAETESWARKLPSNNPVTTSQFINKVFNNIENFDEVLAHVSYKAGFVSPLPGGVITSGYSTKRNKRYTGISMDVPGYGWNIAKVLASADGIVIASGLSNNPMNGYWVVLDHGDGFMTYYLHLTPETVVQPGQKVKAGEHIGWLGNSGKVFKNTGPGKGQCLYFGIKKDGYSVDPEMYIEINNTKEK